MTALGAQGWCVWAGVETRRRSVLRGRGGPARGLGRDSADARAPRAAPLGEEVRGGGGAVEDFADDEAPGLAGGRGAAKSPEAAF